MSRYDVSNTAHTVALYLMITLGTVWVCYAFYTLSQISSI